jgi:hypothetical protein
MLDAEIKKLRCPFNKKKSVNPKNCKKCTYADFSKDKKLISIICQ